MFNTVNNRKGPLFQEDLYVSHNGENIQAHLEGSLRQATLTLPDGEVVRGRVKIIATTDAGRPTRVFQFVSGEKWTVYFGEQYCTGGSTENARRK